MKRIVVFASGGGSNFEALALSLDKDNEEISLLLYDIKNAGVKDRAKRLGIRSEYIGKALGPLDMESHVLWLLRSAKPDLIVLAGYLGIIPASITKAYRGRIINIHPSLLPKYGGRGFHGMKVHEAVLANREVISGCTVHHVDEGIDTGEIIEKMAVKVEAGDTPDTLAARVLKLEHVLLSKVVKRMLWEEK